MGTLGVTFDWGPEPFFIDSRNERLCAIPTDLSAHGDQQIMGSTATNHNALTGYNWLPHFPQFTDASPATHIHGPGAMNYNAHI